MFSPFESGHETDTGPDSRNSRGSAIQRILRMAAALIKADDIAPAIRRGIRSQNGIRGCFGEVAAAYGEYPETAAAKMLWARAVIEDTRSYASNPPAIPKPWHQVSRKAAA